MKHTVIIGGGFAGVNLARELARSAEHRITLIDKNNYNFFPPLIYQVAAGFMSPSDISYPFRKLFNRRPNARFRRGEVRRIDSAECRVYLEHGGSVDYDILVIATGTRPNFFGNQEIENHAYAMKTLGDALAIRNNVLAQLEAACALPPAKRAPYLHFVVAGGGASGVELTGILAEMRRDIFDKDYPELQGEHSRLTLVTADPVLLPPMSQSAQRYTAAELHRLGADVICNDRVTGYDGHTVRLESGRSIAAKSLIWTAGVTAQRTDGIPDECYTRGNRLRTDRQLRVIGLDNVYALGDCALVEGDPAYPNGHPQLGQVAKAQGLYLARALLRGGGEPFAYKHQGDMAIIGRLSAVADFPGGRSSHGIFTWAVWVAVHILALVTFRNRLAAAYNWGIAFLTRNQTLRMIIRPTPPADTRDGSES